MSFESHSDREDFWNDYVERAGWGFDTEPEYDRFLERETQLGGLFDIWSDPNAPDWAQSAAYEQFWSVLDSFGLDRDSFDWHHFKEQYANA